jgi:hypothetical protein
MPLVTIARPAPPAPPIEESAGLAPLFVVLRFLFWTATLKPLLMALAVTGMCTYWLGNQTIRGRFRHHLRPTWVALAAWYVTPWTPWAWLGLAVALYLAPNPGRWLSAREQASLADAACLLAAWQVITPGLEFTVRGVLFLEFTAAGLAPWWLSRAWRTETEVVEVDPILEQWDIDVMGSPRAGDLLNTDFWKDERGRYRLRALPGCATDHLTRAGDHVCSLMNRPRGTVTISHYTDEDGDANDFLVAFTERHDGAVVRYWAEPTLDGRGAFESADTADGRVILGALRGPSGAAHVVILARSRWGKGVIMRQYGTEVCLWDKGFLNVADCKGETEGGAGVPELRTAADVYGWTRDQWRATVELHHELFAARAGRYGRAGRNFWHPDAIVDGYADPLAALMIDELRKLNKAWGRAVVSKLEDMASQGASFGISLIVNTQKGDAESLGSTAFRNDLRGNGTVYIGQAGDTQAAGIAAQGFDVDLSKLPQAPGWWFVKSGLLPTPLVPARGRMLPTRDELEFMDFGAPHGTVEDWLTMTKRAKLHPQDQEIVERWRPEFEDAPPAEAEPEPVYAAEPEHEAVGVAAGVHVEEPRRLAAVPDLQPDTKPALDLIPDVVRKGGVMTRGEIAEAVGIKPEYASDRLKKLKEMGVVTEARTADGRPGWRVVA